MPTFPALHAFCASERVLNTHATSSHTSSRTPLPAGSSSLTISSAHSTVHRSGGFMRMRASLLGLLVVSALWLPVPKAADGPYRLVKDVPIPGDGGWDYLNVDASARRLYISHATKVAVYDLDKDAVVGEIADTPGVHGAVAAFGDRIVTSNGRGNNASIVDAK